MDTSDDLDDLPEIFLDSSVTELNKSFSFEMPDATVIAAQRKLAFEQEAEIKRFKEESATETTEDLVPSDLLESLKAAPVITMPQEYPGIVLNDLDRLDVTGKFSGPRILFLNDVVEKLHHCSDVVLSENLKWYMDSIECSINENRDTFEADDIHCNVIALCLIYLDKRCHRNVDIFKLQDLTLDLLNRTGRTFQSEIFLLQITEHLLKIIHHFHNRIEIARFLNDSNLGDENNEPEHFSRKLSMAITIYSLSDLLGHSKPNWRKSFTVKNLKDIVTNGPRWSVLNPYEQYCMMVMVMNVLKTYSVMGDSDTENISDLKELMIYLSSIKSNEKWNNGEFLKVKNLIAKTKLFVQSRQYQHGQSPVKRSPMKEMRLSRYQPIEECSV